MSIEPEEHDFISQACAEDASRRLAPRLSDDPAVRLAECQGVSLSAAENQQKMVQPAFDKAAERVKFEAWFVSLWPANQLYRRDALPKDHPAYDEYCNPRALHSYEGWLACARQKTEESK